MKPSKDAEIRALLPSLRAASTPVDAIQARASDLIGNIIELLAGRKSKTLIEKTALEALEVAKTIADEKARIETILQIAHWVGNDRKLARTIVSQARAAANALNNTHVRLTSLARIAASYLSEGEEIGVLTSVWKEVSAIHNNKERIRTSDEIELIYATCNKKQINELARKRAHWLPYEPESQVYVARKLEDLGVTRKGASRSPSPDLSKKLADILPETFRRYQNERVLGEFLVGLAPYLPNGLLSVAVGRLILISNEKLRIWALANVAPFVSPEVFSTISREIELLDDSAARIWAHQFIADALAKKTTGKNNFKQKKERGNVSPPNITRQIDEGQLPNATKSDEILDLYLTARKVSEDLRPALAAEIDRLVARAFHHPPWLGRQERGGELATLTAPLFLKRVYADEIGPDCKVYKEVIRSLDPDLMDAVEAYISQRTRRGSDLGDASGLVFIASRPATNSARKKQPLKPVS